MVKNFSLLKSVEQSHAFVGLTALSASPRSTGAVRDQRIIRAARAIVENLEGRTLMAGDSSVIQTLPYALEFDASNGGIADKNGLGTGLTYVLPNKNNNEYQPALIDMVGGRLRITTTGSSTAGGPWENDNTLVDALQTQFNGSVGSFSVSTRLIGPLGYLDNPSEQGGLIFGPDQDNYVKLVAVSQPNGRFLQFVDEQKPSTSFVHTISSANSYTNIGSFASINTLDLTLAGDASTGQITAYYRVNGGALIQVTQSLTLTGTQKAKFFSTAARAGLMAMQKNDLAAETLVFENFAINPGTPQVSRPSVRSDQINPAPNSTDIQRDSYVSAAVNLPNVGKGVDTATLNTSSVKLYRTNDKQAVPGHVSTSGAGDTITFQPNGPLDANTQYTFEVTTGVKDTSGAAFLPFTENFTTGTRITPTDPNLAFEKVSLPTATGQLYSCVTTGPDGKLYATTLTGLIQRFTILADGTLSAPQNITSVQTANGGNRFITSITFDPSSTATNLIAYVSNGQYAFEGATDWTGKVSRLTGANLENYNDLIVGLPRAIRDHVNNQLNFGPDGALYFAQGSSSAMGAADSAWGLRPEHLLSGAVIRVDVGALNQRITAGQGALDVKTESNANGNYNPWAVNAPVTLYATGVRNAYDLVWTRDGNLYAPTNGSAAGGNTPASPAGGFSGTRIDQATNGAYTGPLVPALNNVTVTENDYLFRIQQGGYYGHPNSTRGEYVLDGGNPTDQVDYEEFTQYPSGTLPDRNYRGAAYVFGKNHSPDGAIEYKGNFLNGALDGKLLVVRYSGGADVMALTRDASGNITSAESGIAGLSGFINPLDLTEDVSNGNLYIADYGAQAIYLARPVAPGARIATDKTTLFFNDDYGNSNTTASATQKIRIQNTGTQPLSLPSTALTLSNTTNWVFTSKPALPTTVSPGEYVEVGIAYKATSAAGAGVKTATLTITSNDSTRPNLVVNLRGLATIGTGGQNEPSLQRILDLYQIPVVTGDTNPANTNLFSSTEPLNATNDEVLAQRFTKAGPGAVTIQPLATFAGGTPAVRFGYYQGGTAAAKTELVSVGAADAQTVNPTLNGSTSFDPGSTHFGLYTYFPIFDNTAYSEDSLNVKENTVANRRKMRFYALKNADGSIVPDAYVFTSEDYVNDSTGAYDTNDFMGIIRNVTPANAGPEIGLENTDGGSFADRLAFSRVEQQPPEPKTDPTTGVVTQPPNNVVHDTSVLRIRNTGLDPLTLNSFGVSNSSVWQIVNAPAAGTQIAPGGYFDLTVMFVAHVAPSYPGYNTTPDPSGYAAYHAGFYNGTLTIGTDDSDEPTTSVQLSGWFQEKSEQNQEPSLPVLVNNIFGYTTKILNSGESMFTTAVNGTSPIGEEVLSRYWVRADASAPVKVQQLAAYHGQGNTATIRWAPFGSPTSLGVITTQDAKDGQSILPHVDGGATIAGGSFKPYAASTNPLSAFQFKVDPEWGDDSMNKAVPNNPNDLGHHVRVFPARDRSGNIIANTWLLGMDYLGINYDYQDNVYLITNMRPMPPATPASLSATPQPNGIGLDWPDTTGAPLLAGYNVYRSTAATGPFSKLNSDPVTASQLVDGSAVAGTTYYYRVTAVDSWQGESGNSTVVSAVRTADNQPPATPANLAALGVGNGVSLSWNANNDTDLAGYRVYRSSSAGGAYILLNTSSLITQTTYLDNTATGGSTWFYEISAVDFSGNESPLTAPASATAGDTAAPATPSNLSASSANTGIQLTWSAGTESDLAGYRLYRSGSSGGTFSLISGGSLVTSTSFVDTTANLGETWFYEVTAVDTTNNESPTSVPVSGTRSATAPVAIRVNVGGTAYTDGNGKTWLADQYFTGGTAAISSFDVAGTTDDTLYLDRRWGAFSYSIPATNGQYILNLHFTDPLYTTAGKRLFSVKVEGNNVLTNFDIAAQGGGKAKLVKSFAVNITDGVLDVQTIKNLDNPIISAIELIPMTLATPTTLTATAATPRGVTLDWADNVEAELAGYNVYRANSASGNFARVNTSLLTTSAYTDLAAIEGQVNYYRVTAVDTNGNESLSSSIASATAPVVADGTGLIGKYYSGINFNTLKLTRTDSGVNFDWGSGSPNPAVPVDNFSARWTGKIKAAVTGAHTFTFRGSDGVRLWVNGTLLIDKWIAQGTTDNISTAINLIAGQKYSIQLDYFEGTGAASAKLYWQTPTLTKGIIPRGYLYTG